MSLPDFTIHLILIAMILFAGIKAINGSSS